MPKSVSHGAAPTAAHLTPADYLKKILTARVYDVAVESDLQPATALSRRLHNTVLLKREDQQPVFSFKLRGAYNKIAHLTKEQLAKGVICASAGNHAQGVALSARKLGIRAVIVMPTTTPQVKIDAVKGFGGEVVLHGDSYSDAYTHALTLQKKQGLTFVHPFDDPDVIAGQGTIAMEMLRQLQSLGTDRLDAVFVAIGGGGLISGVANYIKAIRPDIRVIGVQMTDSDAMMRSVGEGERVNLVARRALGAPFLLIALPEARVLHVAGLQVHDRRLARVVDFRAPDFLEARDAGDGMAVGLLPFWEPNLVIYFVADRLRLLRRNVRWVEDEKEASEINLRRRPVRPPPRRGRARGRSRAGARPPAPRWPRSDRPGGR